MDDNSVERFLGDEALRRGWKVPVDAAPAGKRVLVVGAGPSGLSAAYHLTRLRSRGDDQGRGRRTRRHDMEPEQA
jgi:NADPH-dependent glutamate synthase beta subunit-like oxidoreductase